jgi:hypothetical protein
MKYFLRCSAAGLALAAVLHAQQFDTRIANPSFPPKTGPRVVIDAAHFNFAAHTDAFVDVLRSDGFRVSSQTTRWNAATLSQTDVLVVMGPKAVEETTLVAKGVEHYWWSDEGRQSAFTSAEVLAVVRWIRAGGSLLLVVDHSPHASAARMLLQAFGVDVRDSMTWDGNRRPPDYVYGPEPIWQCYCVSFILFSRDYASLGAHPILEGRNASERLNRVTTYGGSSLVGPVGSAPLLLLSAEAFDFWKDPPERGGAEHRVPAAGRAQAVAFPLDAGRVVVVSEFGPFTAAWGFPGDPDGKIGIGMAYAGADDRQFVVNTIRWLARVIR